MNVSRLAQFPAGSEVTPDVLLQAGVVKNRSRPVKILGNGGLDVTLTVRAHKFSASARKRIEDAGGVAEEVSGW